MPSESKLSYTKFGDSVIRKAHFTSYGSKSPVVLAFEKSVANSEPRFTLEIIHLLPGSVNQHPPLVYNLDLSAPSNSLQNLFPAGSLQSNFPLDLLEFYG